MKEIADLLNEMLQSDIIGNYAIFGAVAQMRYTESVMTMDLDVLVAMPNADSLAVLRPIYDFCALKGHHPEGEAIRIGAWPVQFIPAFDDLSQEAMEHAENADLDGVLVRVVKADYLAAMALKAGRAKDKARIIALLEAEVVKPEELAAIANRHGMQMQWSRFKENFLNED